MSYKINVVGLWFASVKTDNDKTLDFNKVEQISEMMEVQISPKTAEGALFGNGKKVHSTSRKTSYEIALDLTTLPQKYKSYMEGSKITSGVESATSKDEPNAFALGFMVEKTEGKRQCIWFPYCKAKPMDESVKQSEDNIVYSNDKLVVTALEHKAINRFYTKIDEDDTTVTAKMVTDFFAKVQTGNVISAQ